MIPDHVLSAFNATGSAEPGYRPLGPEWGHGIRRGGLVFSKAPELAPFSARMRDQLKIPGMSVARPVRATDGRFVVGGWRASVFSEGQPERRMDELVALGTRVAEELAPSLDVPEGRLDVFAQAENEAWSWCDKHYGEIDAPTKLGHSDLAACVLFDGSAAPLLVEFTPFARPRPQGMTAAQAAADIMIASAEEGIDLAVMNRFAHIPYFEQLVLRGVILRDKLSQMHPDATELSKSNISSVKSCLMSRGSDKM